MDTIIHADIFFFLSAIAIIVVASLFTVALLYAIKILRDVRYIARRVRSEGEEIIKDVDAMREVVKRENFKLSTVVTSLFRLFKRRKERKEK